MKYQGHKVTLKIVPFSREYLTAWEAMRRELYGEIPADEMARDALRLIDSPEENCVVACDGDEPVGFAEMSLRKYVDGCASSPVAYLEGIYIVPASRGRGAGRLLFEAVERWAVDEGCREFASDSRLEDLSAQEFHRHFGFEETGRIVQFKRKLDQ